MGNSESTPSTPSSRSKDKDKDKEKEASRTSSSPAETIPISQRKSPHTPKIYTPQSSAASTSTSTEQAQASHSRSRSQTTPSQGVQNMGNAESKQKVPARATTLDTPSSHHGTPSQSAKSPMSRPVDVPQQQGYQGERDDDLTPPTSPPFGMPASVFNNPPRLPLPIERDPEPASPIISPADAVEASSLPPLENETDDAELPKTTSLLSQTTLGDDDDEAGAADVQQFTMETDSLGPKIPITFTWRGEGRSVYVTGTFAHWEKKFRMHRTTSEKGESVFTTTIPLSSGTHHITFLVDGDPKTSLDLPTTVDFANALVNYIEVAATPQSPTTEKSPTAAMAIPGATAARTARSDLPLLDDQPLPGPPRTSDGVSSSINETTAPATNLALRPHSLPTQPPPPGVLAGQQAGAQQAGAQRPRPPSKKIPRPKYTNQIPDVLIHLDLYNTPNDPRYNLAQRAIQHLPQPPSLPMFMSKSILNATTPQKDDASVLTMPNHTVLNHLATSSIRQGVLATSGTTRYKRKVSGEPVSGKFLTTIMYKPTSDDG